MRFLVALMSCALMNAAACNFSRQPSQVVEDLVRAVERGDVDKAMTFLSSGFISRQGIEPVKQGLSQASLQLKEHGGIRSIKVVKKDVVGDVAEVTLEVVRGNGGSATVRYKLIREDGTWKVDSISDVSNSVSNAPLHPEKAVEDVANWANQTGAASVKDWIKRQSAPPVCRAQAIDRSSLPDEVKFHDVDDAELRQRLTNGLKPVLAFVGCENTQGIVLYKGPTIYAWNLDGGHIAITPGSSYFIGSGPDESIFHELAKLRIVLAREIFRQIIVVETPREGLNQADMMLRRELKLNYLAGLVSLTIDKEPTVLDRAALDIDLYGKPPGIPAGTQITPDLRQIQDIFGAANQDYKGGRSQ